MPDSIGGELRRLKELKRRGDVHGLIRELKNPAQAGIRTVRGRAALYLGELRAEAAAPSLRPLLKDKRAWSGRFWAAYALGSIGDRTAVPAIIHLLDDPDSDVRKVAAMALGEIGDRSAIPHLSPLLRHPDWSLRASAVYALTLINEPGAKKAAAAQYRRERPLRRRVIRRNLRKFARRRGLEEVPNPRVWGRPLDRRP